MYCIINLSNAYCVNIPYATIIEFIFKERGFLL